MQDIIVMVILFSGIFLWPIYLLLVVIFLPIILCKISKMPMELFPPWRDYGFF